MIENKKYLITGGTGFIGSALVKRLVKEGQNVRVLDNNIRGAKEHLKEVINKIEFIEADIRDKEQVEKACKNIDIVCHLAYINGTEYFYSMPDLVLDVGVKGMINVIDGCIKNKVKELVLASSSEVYQTPLQIPTKESVSLSIPDPLNPRYSYGGGKIISELMAINYGKKYFKRVLIFRPHNVYGPCMGWEHVIPQFIIRMKELCKGNKKKQIKFQIQGSGEETRAFVFIDDFIDGLITLLDKGKHLEIYNIGSMNEISIRQLADYIGKYFKKEIIIIPKERTQGSTKRRCPDITKLKKLGYNPIVSLSKGINITTKWYCENSEKIKKIANK